MVAKPGFGGLYRISSMPVPRSSPTMPLELPRSLPVSKPSNKEEQLVVDFSGGLLNRLWDWCNRDMTGAAISWPGRDHRSHDLLALASTAVDPRQQGASAGSARKSRVRAGNLQARRRQIGQVIRQPSIHFAAARRG